MLAYVGRLAFRGYWFILAIVALKVVCSQMTLDKVKIGTESVVSHVKGSVGDRQRLGEMGLICGTPVRVLRVAPLGDPLELRLRGYSLSLRKRDAANVSVKL